MTDIIEKAKSQLLKMIDDYGSDPYRLKPHLNEILKWAEYLAGKYPKADKEVVILSVWLHDLGHYPLPTEIDHAIRAEQRSKDFLGKENYPAEKISAVLHCVRSHRCRDIMPETLEAKIIACADSASHLTDSMYFDIAKDDKDKKIDFRAYAKMDRDFRDLANFPEIQNKLAGLYHAWQEVIKEYEKIDLK